jgi:hypothetical protein
MHRGARSRVPWLIAGAVLVLAAAWALVLLLRQDAPAGRDDPVVVAAANQSAGVGRPAPSQVPPARPEAVELPSGASMPVDVASTGADGVPDLPVDIRRAGWWDGGSRIGDPFGTIVLAAHVDSVKGGIGPIAELLRARPGQRIRVSGDGTTQLFEVASARLTPRASLSDETAVFSVEGPSRLVLITCAGPFDGERGGYRDNMIVIARPVDRPRPAAG